MMRSMIPCDEVLDNGSKCGRTPTERVEAEVMEGLHGANKTVFHFCERHWVDDESNRLPRIVENWMIAQRR